MPNDSDKVVTPPDSLQEVGMPRRKRSPLAAMMLMAAVLGSLPPMPEPKPKRKCLLKTCDVMTDHSGGYCCAEHHAEGKRHTDQAHPTAAEREVERKETKQI